MLPDWKQLVRAHLAPLRLTPERELEIVEELALHLEAAYETALALGLGEEAAESHAVAQISDWRLLESELARAETPSRMLAAEPWIEQKGGLSMEALWQDLRYGARMLLKNPGFRMMVEGAPPQTPGQQPITALRVATPGYFCALGIPWLTGRVFQASDRAETEAVVIIDQVTARRHWPAGQALGKRIKLGGPQEPWLTVIGIVGDVRYHGLEYRMFPTVYMPHAQSPFKGMMLAVRTAANPLALVTAVKEEVAALDRNLPISKILTLEQLVAGSVTQRRFNLMLLGTFATLALALAAVGIYGVIAYAVTQRTREFGIRMAVGAQAGDVLRLVIGHGIKLALAGVLLGLGGALALTRLMKTLLFDVSATDPLTFAVIALLLIVVALLACWIPARRATKVDPLIALRCE